MEGVWHGHNMVIQIGIIEESGYFTHTYEILTIHIEYLIIYKIFHLMQCLSYTLDITSFKDVLVTLQCKSVATVDIWWHGCH